MCTRFLLTLVLALTAAPAADAGTIFSFNGLGYPIRRVDARTLGMGGAGRAVIDGLNFSTTNPALITSFRRPAANAHFWVQRRSLEDATGASRAVGDGDIGMLRLALPVRPGTVLGVGVEGVTDVDAALVDSVGSGATAHFISFKGAGGLQALNLTLGQRAARNLFLGVQVDLYILGTINEVWSKDFPSSSTTFFSEDHISRTARGAQFALGAIYTVGNFSLGGTFRPGATITQRITQRNLFAERRLFSEEVYSERDLKLPTVFGGGVAYARSDKWMFAADVERALWADTSAGRHDTFEVAGGILYRTGRADPVFPRRRIGILAGGYHRSLYFDTGGTEPVTETAMTFGLTFPFKASSGSFRYALEAGSRGDRDLHGASEFYIRQTFSIMGWLR